MKRQLFGVTAAISLLWLLFVVAFIFGKAIGPDDNGNPNGMYWLGWRVDQLWWLSAGKMPGLRIDLELFMILIAAILPGIWLLKRIHAGRRVDSGFCRNCHYDIRATPQRCPECGADAL